MDRTTPSPRPPRFAVLIVIQGDGHIEAFAERHVDVHVARVPVSFSREAEQTAEDVAELLLPPRFRELFRRDRLRAVGTTRPLLPTTLARAIATNDLIAALDTTTSANAPIAESEVVAWA